jgi:hypothetical protein
MTVLIISTQRDWDRDCSDNELAGMAIGSPEKGSSNKKESWWLLLRMVGDAVVTDRRRLKIYCN